MTGMKRGLLPSLAAVGDDVLGGVVNVDTRLHDVSVKSASCKENCGEFQHTTCFLGLRVPGNVCLRERETDR